MKYIDTDVLIVGAGPTGLTAATHLARDGVKHVIVDAQSAGENTSRAAVVHARTLEVLEPLDVTPRLCEIGIKATRFTVRDHDSILISIDFESLATKYPYTLMISQADTERILLERHRELGGKVFRPCRLVRIDQDYCSVVAQFDDGTVVHSKYAIAADGMHSTVRESSEIDFDGAPYPLSLILADVEIEGKGVQYDEVILYFSNEGMLVLAPLPGGTHRVVAVLDDAPETPSRELVQKLLRTRGPQQHPVSVKTVIWGSRFRVHHRVAVKFRKDRIFLAGDAAHVHSPAGGQGMNTGIQDGAFLAKLLRAAIETGNPSALERYSQERRPIAQKVVSLADRLTRLATAPGLLRTPRNILLRTISISAHFRQKLAMELSGLAYKTPSDE